MTLVVAMSPSPAFGGETSGFRALSGEEAATFVVPGDTQLVTSFFLSPYGLTYERYQQYFRTAQVLGGQITLYRNGSGTITTVIGSHFPNIVPTNAIHISRADAAAIAGRDVGPAEYRGVDLMIDPESGRYFFQIESRKLDSRWFHWIDANNGQVLNKYNAIETSDGIGVKGDTKDMTDLTTLHNDKGRPSLRGYWLQSSGDRQLTYNDDNNGGQASIMVDADNHWTESGRNSPGHPAGVDAQYYASVVYDYYQSIHGRDSFDSNGASMKSIVHIFANNYNNAFWNGNVVAYGDGDNVDFREFSGSLDVVGHEWTHAVTDFTSNLIYQGESGALNESFSDIMGNTIEFFADGGGLDPTVTPDWLVGEDIDIRSPADDQPGFRNMADPQEDGDPDYYSERYTGTGDNGGVHINSGIPNHAYYLLVTGGSNAGCDTVGSNNHTHTADCDVTVSAIELADAEQIFFLAFTALPSNASMSDARNATVATAVTQFGASSPQALSTSDAWEAVGLAPPAPDTTSPTVVSTSPGNTSDVAVTTTIEITFSEPMNKATAQGAFSISLSVTGSFSWSGETMVFTPDANLTYSKSYTYSVSTAAEDLAGNLLDTSYSWTFTTSAVTVGDTVTITKAVYNSKKNGGELKVEATSSASPGAELRITDIGGAVYDIVMTYNEKKDKYSATVSGLSPKPESVLVTSSAGGSATSDVGGK
jgi:Zn-dependent metalloprotease